MTYPMIPTYDPHDPPPWNPPDTITPEDVAVWEAAWHDNELVPFGRAGDTPDASVRAFVMHTQLRRDGEQATVAYGPDRLGRVLMHYCGDRVFVRHAFMLGQHWALGCVVGRVQAGAPVRNPFALERRPPQPPPRLIVSIFEDEDGERYTIVLDADCAARPHDPRTDSPLTSYVREDLLADEPEAALRRHLRARSTPASEDPR